MFNLFKVRREVKAIRTMPFRGAAIRFRRAVYTGTPEHPRIMTALAERALELSPPGEIGAWKRYAAAMRAGRRIKVATGKITAVDGVLIEPYNDDRRVELDDETVREIDSVFEEE